MINNYCSVVKKLFSHSPFGRQVNLVVFDFWLYFAFQNVDKHVSILFRRRRLYLVQQTLGYHMQPVRAAQYCCQARFLLRLNRRQWQLDTRQFCCSGGRRRFLHAPVLLCIPTNVGETCL